MKVHGRTSVYALLGDMLVYRNLAPLDPRLPPASALRAQAGLPAQAMPRKTDYDYAQVMAALLQAARRLEAPQTRLDRLIYLGDTRLNDGTAFTNLCRAGGWLGLAFIGAERPEPARVEVSEQEGKTLVLANRWAALSDFETLCRQRDFPIDERTVVVVDLDKTALGARGRNDHVIDQARLEAVHQTVGDLVGARFDPQSFEQAYRRLNQPEFHPFTRDNQDYLAYICLILSSGLWRIEALVEAVRAGQLPTFEAFIAAVAARAGELSPDLRAIHADIYRRVQQGDPTPFKEFRYNEYLATVSKMGSLDDEEPVEAMLRQEIVVTQEVVEAARSWQAGGALLFGLSDKPDEASIPTRELAARGYRPIHKVETHAVGGGCTSLWERDRE